MINSVLSVAKTILLTAVFACGQMQTLASAMNTQILTSEKDIDEIKQENVASCSKVQVPVLMYHRLLKHNPGHDEYTITPREFECDLIFLRDNGYTAIGTRQLIDFIKLGTPLPEKPVMLTFDDGHFNNLYYAAPLLEEYGMKGVIFAVGSYSENATRENDPNPNYAYISWEQMESIPPCFEIQSHTWDMHKMSPRKGIGIMRHESRADYEMALASDLLKLQDKIKKHTGKAPVAFAYPFGVCSKRAVPVMRAVGIEASFCSVQGISGFSPGNHMQLYGIKRLLRSPEKSAARLISRYSA